MMGAGRSEVARSIFGMDPYDSGKIFIDGKERKFHSIREAIRGGVAMITEDRGAYGFVGVRSIEDNIALPNLDFLASNGWLKHKEIEQRSKDIFGKLPGSKRLASKRRSGTLSGGNQQKVVLAKWLVRNVRLLILDEPTRGIDVGAKQEIYNLITELSKQGIAILMISSDMPEVLFHESQDCSSSKRKNCGGSFT